MQKTDQARVQNRLQAAKDQFMQVLQQQAYPAEITGKLAFTDCPKEPIL
jgi:hypothetical protein